MKTIVIVRLRVVLLGMQLFRPVWNVSASRIFSGQNDITVLFPPSPEARKILAESCYDCHSNTTRYPWYAKVQPVAWWLAGHVREARVELNFAEFGAYPARRQIKKLEELCDQVRDRAMPLKSYLVIHRDAKLTDAQIAALSRWAEDAQDQIAAK